MPAVIAAIGSPATNSAATSAVPSASRKPSVASTSGAIAKAAAVIRTPSTRPIAAASAWVISGKKATGTTAQPRPRPTPSHAVLRTSDSAA